MDVIRNQGPPRAPAPSPAFVLPLAPAQLPPPPPTLPTAGRWKGSCKERCGDSGRPCALPAPHPGQPHGDKRGPFYRLAVAGQTVFVERERLELAAVTSADFGDPNAPGARPASRAEVKPATSRTSRP